MKLALIALVAACGAPARPPASPRQAAVPTAHVALRHVSTDAWEVTYRLPAPVRTIAFARGGYEFRHDHWKVATPGIELVRVAGRDFLRSAMPFRELTLRIATYHANPEKDYQVFLPYSDGSHLVYTGQFDLASLSCDPACDLANPPDDIALAHDYELVPLAGEHVVVDGKLATATTRWTAHEDGTYAYFGTTKPVHADAVIGVVDPGVPAWLRTRVETLLPKLFDFYGRELGVRLAARPVVFVSYGVEPNPRSRSFSGGTLQGVVQLEFRLPREVAVDADLAATASHLIAHEAAHLWNTRLFHHEVEHGEWLHEGGAEAFAWRALRALGVIDDQKYGAAVSRAASLCLMGLDGEGLRKSSRAGRYKNHYHCGATIDLLVEGALRAAGSPDDLFAFWARVFASGKDHAYDDRGFLAALRAIDGAAPTAALVEHMLAGPTRDLEGALRAELERLGIRVEVAESHDHDYGRLAAGHVLRAIVTSDCGGSAAFDFGSTHAQLRDATSCKNLGALERIEQLGSYSLATEAAAAYDHVAACRPGGAVTVRGGDREVSVPCGATPLAPRTPYLRLTGYPNG